MTKFDKLVNSLLNEVVDVSDMDLSGSPDTPYGQLEVKYAHLSPDEAADTLMELLRTSPKGIHYDVLDVLAWRLFKDTEYDLDETGPSIDEILDWVENELDVQLHREPGSDYVTMSGDPENN
jgi:hypothetical protein